MENLFYVIIGVVCIIIGISNRKGNISLLHSYHRKRVSEENRIPFGKVVGLGMIIIGVALIAVGGLFFMAEAFKNDIYSTVGTVVLITGLVIGLGISFYGMIKYNKGIF